MNRLTKIIKGKCGHDQIYYTPKYGNPITPIDMTDWGYNTLANHLYDILNRLKRYEDLKEQLLDKYNELKNKIDGDGVENYTNGYKYGHRNGQIELLEWILKIDTGYREEAEKALEGNK